MADNNDPEDLKDYIPLAERMKKQHLSKVEQENSLDVQILVDIAGKPVE